MCIQVTTIKLKGLPFKTVSYISDDKLIAAGHDAMPAYFVLEGDAWVFKGCVDKPSAAKGAKKASAGGVSAARSMWANKADLGAETIKTSKLDSLHQNSVSGLEILDDGRFSTCGYDGRVVLWDMASLDTAEMPH